MKRADPVYGACQPSSTNPYLVVKELNLYRSRDIKVLTVDLQDLRFQLAPLFTSLNLPCITLGTHMHVLQAVAQAERTVPSLATRYGLVELGWHAPYTKGARAVPPE